MADNIEEKDGAMLWRFEWDELMEDLSAMEQYNIMRAVINYARYGTEPTTLVGAEKICFKAIKQSHDRNVQRRENYKANGKKGGRPKVLKESEKETKKNQKKPKGFLDENPGYENGNPPFVVENLPIPKPIPKPIPEKNNHSSYSSSTPEQEEKEEEIIFQEFLWTMNVKNPSREVKRFIAYNAKHSTEQWGKMTLSDKLKLLSAWKPEETGERCDNEFVQMWQQVMLVLSGLISPEDRKLLWDDCIHAQIDTTAKRLLLRLPNQHAIDLVERNVQEYKNHIRAYMNSKKVNSLMYTLK